MLKEELGVVATVISLTNLLAGLVESLVLTLIFLLVVFKGARA